VVQCYGKLSSTAFRFYIFIWRYNYKGNLISFKYQYSLIYNFENCIFSRRADDEFGEGILGNQKLKRMYYLNVSESGIDSR
jgi:hypothetical protein